MIRRTTAQELRQSRPPKRIPLLLRFSGRENTNRTIREAFLACRQQKVEDSDIEDYLRAF
jgi:hypothetical protein